MHLSEVDTYFTGLLIAASIVCPCVRYSEDNTSHDIDFQVEILVTRLQSLSPSTWTKSPQSQDFWHELPCENHGAATTVVICLSLFVDSDSVVSGDIIGFSMGMTFLAPILIAKLFVFGFVDDEDMSLPAPFLIVRPSVGVPLGTHVSVLAPLKSSGFEVLSV